MTLEPPKPECKWCGFDIEPDENPREHRRFCKLNQEFDGLMDQVEVKAKALANMCGGRWSASSRGTGFRWRITADPKAQLKELLKMNPQLVTFKKGKEMNLTVEAGLGLIDLAKNGPRQL